ncbi:hypothetical protein OL548_10330 [Lysinibacillus sp. MHQ-1]|nr:hypothetical protein OL548_10330 [Lysinibacillus sp. MHQ-1]
MRSQYYLENGLFAHWQQSFEQQEIAKASFFSRGCVIIANTANC